MRCTYILTSSHRNRRFITRAFCTVGSRSQARTASRLATRWLSRDHVLSALSSQPHVTVQAGCASCPGCWRCSLPQQDSLPHLYLSKSLLSIRNDLVATIPTPYASEPPCAVDSVSLLRGSKTSSHHSRIRTNTQPDAIATHYRRWETRVD
jgi:hypothetical protein